MAAPLASLPLAPPLFGVLVAGRPVQSDFRVASAQSLIIELRDPGSIRELSVFLLPGAALPAGSGALVFFAPPPFTAWANLGALTMAAPSTTIHTGWAASAELAAAPCVQLGVSVEPAEAVVSAASALHAAEWDKLGFAQLLARDLTEFLGSFAQMRPEGNRLVLPVDAVDRWLAKFQSKFRSDPGFLFRKPSG
jgi:hypothetical protein